ncbi:unnamed protein product [Lymnaea stagnalis]|uniref:Uncharacterized protein n=1 Tax=Lymnaea stagnalis TaxID=6523 RepID=A0AAV2I0V5_LYMST
MLVKLSVVLLVVFVASTSLAKKRTRHVLSKRVTCGKDESLCPGNDKECIRNNWFCDTKKDCPNGTDEVNCPTDCSGDNQFMCPDGNCIPRRWKCDNDNDCWDATDKKDCAGDPWPQPTY